MVFCPCMPANKLTRHVNLSKRPTIAHISQKLREYFQQSILERESLHSQGHFFANQAGIGLSCLIWRYLRRFWSSVTRKKHNCFTHLPICTRRVRILHRSNNLAIIHQLTPQPNGKKNTDKCRRSTFRPVHNMDYLMNFRNTVHR